MSIFYGKTTVNIPKTKFLKNIGILYKERDNVSKESLLSLYYAHIHTYVNYANLAWASTIRTNLKKIHSQQKHVFRIVFHKDKCSGTKELFVQNKDLNVYQLNIFNNLISRHKVKAETAPAVFLPKFHKPVHPYPTNSSKLNHIKPTSQLRRSTYGISLRGPAL